MIIFDLDGTLADCEHRRWLIDKTKRNGSPNWGAFYAACVDDKPIAPIVDMFRMLHDGGTQLEIWSGRSDEVRWDTMNWLTKHVFWGNDNWTLSDSDRHVRLLMRPKSSMIPDDQLKEQWLDQALRDGLQITAVVDDRQKVVNMWRRRGIICLQCAEGDF